MMKQLIAAVLLLGCMAVWGVGAVEAAPKRKAAQAQAEPKQMEFTDPTTGMEFIWVSGGCFQMGDTFGDGFSAARPAHKVCVSGFYMGKYEVTQGQWKKLMDSNPSKFTSCGPDCPVEQVNWDDAQGFIAKLNASGSRRFRLPTEAEWEYAARSGGKEEKWAGTCSQSDLVDYAWYNDNSGNSTHTVGQKRPNGLGLYDMSGNVSEWCADWYGDHYYTLLKEGAQNPRGPKSGAFHVFRGGGWDSSADYARASTRASSGMGYRLPNVGFRVVSPQVSR